MNKVNEIKARYQELEKQLQDPAVINDPQKLKTVAKEHGELKEITAKIEELEKVERQIKENEGLIKGGEEELKTVAEEEISHLLKQKKNWPKQ